MRCDYNKCQNSNTFAVATESSLSESALHPNEAELIKTAHFSLHWAKAENSPSFHVASDLLGLEQHIPL